MEAELERFECSIYRGDLLLHVLAAAYSSMNSAGSRPLSSVSPNHDPHCPCQIYPMYPERLSNDLFHHPASLEFPNDIIPPLTPQLVLALSATEKVSDLPRVIHFLPLMVFGVHPPTSLTSSPPPTLPRSSVHREEHKQLTSVTSPT